MLNDKDLETFKGVSESEMRSIPELVDLTIKRLEMHGWARGCRAGQDCLFTAINIITNGPPEQKMMNNAVRDLIPESEWYPSGYDFKPPRPDIIYWNDKPGRTFDEVKNLLLRVKAKHAG